MYSMKNNPKVKLLLKCVGDRRNRYNNNNNVSVISI